MGTPLWAAPFDVKEACPLCFGSPAVGDSRPWVKRRKEVSNYSENTPRDLEERKLGYPTRMTYSRPLGKSPFWSQTLSWTQRVTLTFLKNRSLGF